MQPPARPVFSLHPVVTTSPEDTGVTPCRACSVANLSSCATLGSVTILLFACPRCPTCLARGVSPTATPGRWGSKQPPTGQSGSRWYRSRLSGGLEIRFAANEQWWTGSVRGSWAATSSDYGVSGVGAQQQPLPRTPPPEGLRASRCLNSAANVSFSPRACRVTEARSFSHGRGCPNFFRFTCSDFSVIFLLGITHIVTITKEHLHYNSPRNHRNSVLENSLAEGNVGQPWGRSMANTRAVNAGISLEME